MPEKVFTALLEEMAAMFRRKSSDYGVEHDPLANLRGSAAAGVEPWRAAWVRALDKVQRINTFCRTGVLSNEGVDDSLIDLAVYALLTRILHTEARG